MALEEQLLTASIRDSLRQANGAEGALSNLQYYNTPDNVEDGEHATDLDEKRGILSYWIKKCFQDLMILAERMDLSSYRADIAAKLSEYKDVAEVKRDEEWGFYAPALTQARTFFEPLETMTLGKEVTGLGILQTVLENTGKIIVDKNIIPSNEAEVRKAIREVLGYAFRDVVKERVFPKTFKNYQADIGVKSLMAIAEYKFATSKKDLKHHLDEVYADMKGYSGDPQWRTFFAVLYQTESWYHQKDIEAEFRLVKADLNWIPILVTGPGARIPKADAADEGQNSNRSA